MTLDLFNFVEDNAERILTELVTRIPKAVPAYARLPRAELRRLAGRLLDGYVDLLVTGQTDALEEVLRYLTRMQAARKLKVSDVLLAILVVPQVIRRLLAAEWAGAGGASRELDRAIEQTETTGHRAAASFVDVFQAFVDRRIQQHNDYLDGARARFGIDLSRLVVFKA